MKAIILAAGYATRLYPLTENQPKPLLKIGPKKIADFLLDRIAEIDSVNGVYVVTNQKFHSHFEKWAEEVNTGTEYPQFDVVVVNDKTLSNETRLGAIADIQFVLEQEKIDDDIVILAGDNIFNIDFDEIHNFYKEKNAPSILVHPLEDKSRLTSVGVVEIDETNKIIGFEEKPDVPKSNLIAPPVYFIPQKQVSLIHTFLSSSDTHDAPGYFISWLYKQLPVFAFVMHEQYYDIGTLEMYNKVNSEFQQK